MPWMAAVPAIASLAGTAMSMVNKGSAASAGGTSGAQAENRNQTTSVNYSPQYTDFLNNLLGRTQEVTGREFTPFDVNEQVSGLTPDQKQAFDQIRGFQGQYQPYFDQGKGALDRVSGMDSQANAQPYLDAAGNATRPWEAGSGAISQSMGKWTDPGNRDAYMQDYSGALGRANDLTQRRFEEQTMPGLNKQFAMGEGALGRSNYQKMGSRALRDLGSEMSGNSITAMNDAYKTAGSLFNTDQARTQAGGIASGELANKNMSALGDLASRNASITSGAVQNGINVGNAYSQQAGALSNINLMNTNALLQSGEKQQASDQAFKTANYQQHLASTQWDPTMLGVASNTIRGLNIPQTTNTQTSTNSNTSGSSSSSPSTMGTLLGGLSAANTLGSTTDPKTGKTTGGFQNLGGWLGDQFASGNPNPTQVVSPIGGYTGSTYDPNTGAYTPTAAARGGRIPHRYAQGGAVPRGILSRRRRQDNYAVGGDIAVGKGLKSRSRKGGPQGALGGIGAPPLAMPPPPDPQGGAFSRQGGLSLPPPPDIPMLPRPRPQAGALGMMR